MLLVLNHELGADFDPRAFEHRAFYDTVAHRIEMHLVSMRDQTVDDPGPRSGAVREGRVDPDRDQHASTTGRAWRRCSRRPGSGSRPGRPIRRRRSVSSSERRCEQADPRGAGRGSRGARLRGAGERLAHAAADRRRDRVHPGRSGHVAAMSDGGRRVLRHAAVPPAATAARQGWVETRTAKGTPCFSLPDGGTITFEPGGQIEYSSPAVPLAERAAGARCGRWCCRSAPRRRARGSRCSPWASIRPTAIDGRAAPAQHQALRSGWRSTSARRGPAGARMMRQTAAFQVAVDLDDEPWLRWRVLNAAAPYVVAIFANSPVYAGTDTGCASVRAQVWRALDPARTGLPWGAGIAGRGLSRLRARGAGDPAAGRGRRASARSASGSAAPDVTLEEWHDHLTTLFPEVRPRGHFELRSADAVAPQWYAAPLALAVGDHVRAACRSAPPPICSVPRIWDCSIGPGASGCATPGSREPRPIWWRSRSRAAGARTRVLQPRRSGAGAARSSTATPCAARCSGRRPVTAEVAA